MKKTIITRNYQLRSRIFNSDIFDRINDERCKLKYMDNVSRILLDLMV